MQRKKSNNVNASRKIYCAAVKHWGKIISLVLIAVLVGVGGQMIIGRTQPGEFWIIFGGNQDPGDGNGNGLARDQMIAGGWTTRESSFQVQWGARAQRSIQDSDEAMVNGQAAIKQRCKNQRCIVAGFSIGTQPALQVSSQMSISPGNTYLFGGPQPSTGIWHNAWVDNPWIEPALQLFGQFAPDQFVAAGTHSLFDVRDPYANSAPSCSQPWGLLLDGHRIISRAESQQRVWTGVDGVVNHEANYVPPPQLPLSGNDPSPEWAGCYLGDWHSTPNSPDVGPEDQPR